MNEFKVKLLIILNKTSDLFILLHFNILNNRNLTFVQQNIKISKLNQSTDLHTLIKTPPLLLVPKIFYSKKKYYYK